MSTHSILLIDDEAEVLASLKRALRGEGHRLLTATGGRQALELMGANPVSLVVCDLAMPGMDGLELLRRVRERYPQVVRLVLTGQSDISLAARAVNEGEVFRFLTKPWDNDQLRACIAGALERFENGRGEVG